MDIGEIAFLFWVWAAIGGWAFVFCVLIPDREMKWKWIFLGGPIMWLMAGFVKLMDE